VIERDPYRLVIDDIRQLDGEATLLGHAYVLGALHHAWFVKVAERPGEQVAVADPYHRLDDFHYLVSDGGPFETVEVPGFPGRYVMAISPAVR
jgi:hypothetical protein